MRITLKSKEKGDGTFALELATQEGIIQLGDYTKSSTGKISTCYGWNMISFVAKLIGVESVRLLHLVDKGDVFVDIVVHN